MSEYIVKQDKVLYAIYRLCKKLPDSVSVKNIITVLVKNHSDFDVSEVVQLLQGLDQLNYIDLEMYLGGNNNGHVKLYPGGIEAAERYEKSLQPNAMKKKELEDFLTKCCESANFEIGVQFNAYDVGNELGFDRDKSHQYYQQLFKRGYLEDGDIPLFSNTKSVITPKAVDAVQGPMFEQPEGITVNSNKINIQGNVTNSAVAAGDSNTQSLSITQEQINSIRELLDKAKSDLPFLKLNADSKSDYEDHLSVLDRVSIDENIQPELVKKRLRGLRRIAEGATSGAAAAGIIVTTQAIQA